MLQVFNVTMSVIIGDLSLLTLLKLWSNFVVFYFLFFFYELVPIDFLFKPFYIRVLFLSLFRVFTPLYNVYVRFLSMHISILS